MKKIPESFTCECGKVHPFGFYVAAHADVLLTHTCDGCGRKHNILRYHVSLVEKRKQRKAKP